MIPHFWRGLLRRALGMRRRGFTESQLQLIFCLLSCFRLAKLLEDVQLSYLAERPGGWAAVDNWEDVSERPGLGTASIAFLKAAVFIYLSQVLSLGEQQRLGMARLLFHRPRFGVLDQVICCFRLWVSSPSCEFVDHSGNKHHCVAHLSQCTDAVSIDVEEHLYRLAESEGITIVTISQRAALIKHHRQELRLLGANGSWQLFRR